MRLPLTTFVGRLSRETDDAIRFEDAAAASSLTRLAHRIKQLEERIENVGDDAFLNGIEGVLDNELGWHKKRRTNGASCMIKPTLQPARFSNRAN